MSVPPWYELSWLGALRRQYWAVAPKGLPTVRFLTRPPRVVRVGVLPSSFHPVTEAHLALAEAGRAALRLDVIVLSLGRVIVDKAQSGLSPEDRLATLCHIAATRPGYAVAVPSVGLYAEMADAYQQALPGAALTFLIGFDKAEQIFDPKYYQDRASSLKTLFSVARLGVAPRAGKGHEEIRALLQRPENMGYGFYLDELDLDPRLSGASSTQVREALGRAVPQEEDAETLSLLPSEVRPWLLECGAFSAPRPGTGAESLDRYALRGALIGLASQAGASGDIRPFWRLLLAPESADLRARLAAGSLSWAELERLARAR
jgi:nicotinic acid mononucleotide adenylyltransferase